ncbi:hypothetical protein DEFDS_1792 [Deferribacter desulfuricans SSM1]|uniref:Uncharacterized protein n=1 Tax=Deferribacter desulfuricans (strain DSM 14783 / JCM 11476 / NBRC 101012 / SSM1) TaxID=639282 RepID=D3P957_DEFDS|nr:hypothetical protein [Deferribacter desulfuricans]BAI81247.1 hypothetical protein DEFDS_1792 [Deferribacter desulfuricans SSM1]
MIKFKDYIIVMENKTIFYYLLCGHNYYIYIKNKIGLKKIKRICDKEIEFFFNHRYIRREYWSLRYIRILYNIFVINLLARRFERILYRKMCIYDDKYSKFSVATFLALKVYNNHRSFFKINLQRDIFLKELISIAYEKVNNFFKKYNFEDLTVNFYQSNTPLGIELEFSNIGHKAGKLFVDHNEDVLLNFSKYHYYHLMKYMWRFGAYIDAEMPLKQFVRKGGFLEYTFTKHDSVLQGSNPLTNSPQLASWLINESVKFTPVRPHSLHVSLESNNDFKKLPFIDKNGIKFLLICTGDFKKIDDKIVETRMLEKNMKDIVALRKRKNNSKYVNTVEFTHMRLSREFAKKNLYEMAINLMIAYKNMYRFDEILPFNNEIIKWGENPDIADINLNLYLEKVKKGLDLEVSLPTHYKEGIILKIKEMFEKNSEFIKNG